MTKYLLFKVWTKKGGTTWLFHFVHIWNNIAMTFYKSEDRILQVIFLVQTGYTRAEYFLFNSLQVYWGGRQIWEQETASQGFTYSIYFIEGMFWPLEYSSTLSLKNLNGLSRFPGQPQKVHIQCSLQSFFYILLLLRLERSSTRWLAFIAYGLSNSLHLHHSLLSSQVKSLLGTAFSPTFCLLRPLTHNGWNISFETCDAPAAITSIISSG